jgi:hypothetical protein
MENKKCQILEIDGKKWKKMEKNDIFRHFRWKIVESNDNSTVFGLREAEGG